MEYVVHYNIAALVLLITVLVHYVYKKTISTNKTRIFYALVLCALLTTILDITTLVLYPYGSRINIWINYIVNIISFIKSYFIAFFF